MVGNRNSIFYGTGIQIPAAVVEEVIKDGKLSEELRQKLFIELGLGIKSATERLLEISHIERKLTQVSMWPNSEGIKEVVSTMKSICSECVMDTKGVLRPRDEEKLAS